MHKSWTHITFGKAKVQYTDKIKHVYASSICKDIFEQLPNSFYASFIEETLSTNSCTNSCPFCRVTWETMTRSTGPAVAQRVQNSRGKRASTAQARRQINRSYAYRELASCLIYARAFCFKMLPSVKFAEDKVLTFLILCGKNAKVVQPWVLT